MHVTRLILSDFRNHRATSLACDAAAIVLTGANGAGKTNILEALSLLAPGRGLRGAALPDMAAQGSDAGFAISAEIADTGTGDSVAIGTGTRGAAPGRRRARINGAERALNALGEWLAFVWLTPAMDRLFLDSAGGRRRFVDRLTLALEPGHARAASRYEAAMRARTKLLAGDGPPDPHWLAALEAQMSEHGAAIDGARRAMLTAVTEQLARAPLDGFPQPAISLVHADDEPGQPWTAEALNAALRSSRGRDARAGRALTGPHRQDLLVRHSANDMPAAQSSTGEQKALLLSLILAHGDAVAERRGQRPVLLLDEIAAHLDPERRALLFARLLAGGGQCWLTGTEPGLFSAMPGDVLRLTVAGGVVNPD
jgi:DNA replication and repair protein RecF